MPPFQLVDLFARAPEFGIGRRRAANKRLADLRQPHALGMAIEKRGAELLLELLDAAGDRAPARRLSCSTTARTSPIRLIFKGPLAQLSSGYGLCSRSVGRNRPERYAMRIAAAKSVSPSRNAPALWSPRNAWLCKGSCDGRDA